MRRALLIMIAVLLVTTAITAPLPPMTLPAAGAVGEVAAAQEAHDDAVIRLLILERRAADAERDLAEAELELSATQEALTRASDTAAKAVADHEAVQGRFSARLAESYRTRGLGWLELLLTSGDFSEFVNRSEFVSRILAEEALLIEQVEAAGSDAATAVADLDQTRAEQEAKVRSVQERSDELSAAQREQERLVATLGERLDDVRAAARASQERMAEENARAAAAVASSDATASPQSSPTATPTTTRTPTTAGAKDDSAPSGGRQLKVKAYAYALPGRTASGLSVGIGIVAVDPRVIKLGTRLYIPGYGEGLAADTGGDIKGNTIDVWVPTEKQARDWGIKYITITVYD
ncbi:MAG: hypothetical protein KKA32_05415 [Actinobacteria bacterium]|nr:hypothetical protein [Actinomycetota bacterium]